MRQLILVTIFLCIISGGTLQAQTENIILGRPTESSVTLSIMFDKQTEIYIEYGTSPGIYDMLTDPSVAAQETPLELVLTGLAPDTKYYYRTRYRLSGSTGPFIAGPEHNFHTQRAAGNGFTFTVESDEHLYDKKGVSNLYRICLANQAKDKPDFMLTLGDIFGDDHKPLTITSAELKTLHMNYRPFLGSICHSVPLFICLGNHEGEKEYYLLQTPPDNMAVYATLWRKYYYPNPEPGDFYSGNTDVESWGIGKPENYYSWTWGNALFVVLDVYRDQCDTSAKPKNWEWSLGLQQYTWLKNTLESSNAKYKFVFAHHTRGEGRGGVTTARYFEWGGYEADGTSWGFTNKRPGWAKPIHQLFADNGVNIFFQGHDHLFAHEVLDGVIYQEVPMPSDSTYEIGMLANAGAYVSDTLGGSGHLRVAVTSNCVRVDFIRAYLPEDTLNGLHHNGEVAFSYTIGDCPSGVSDVQSKPEILVYPNPAKDRINVSVPDGSAVMQISLDNMLGQILVQTGSDFIDAGNIPNGIYFLIIRIGKTEIRKKVIVCR